MLLLLLLLLMASVAINLVAYRIAKKNYVAVKAASIFPSNAHQFQDQNKLLAQKTNTRIVLFGDSRIAQWQSFPKAGSFEVVGRGIEGETSQQLRARFDADVIDLQPDIVVLQLGINDLTAIGVMPDRQADIVRQCVNNIRYMVDTLLSRGIRTILLTIVPPYRPSLLRLPIWSRDIEAQTLALNAELLHLPASPLLHVIDTQSILQDKTGRWRDDVNADTLHLTRTGYNYLNAAVVPLLRD